MKAILIEFGKRRLNKNIPKSSVSQSSSTHVKINNEKSLLINIENDQCKFFFISF